MTLKKVCVYCASSRKVDNIYFDAAKRLGQTLAKNGITLIYGGGARGLMGTLADAALAEGGQVIGIIPGFMCELEWNHPHITELKIVNDLHERKKLLLDNTDAVIALPGGSGTLDELFETISLKRLGIYTKPIVIVNTNGFYDPLIKFLHSVIEQQFMDKRHLDIWSISDSPEQVIKTIHNSPVWNESARHFAGV